MFESRTRPCLLFQIRRCSAPCTGEISREAYMKLVDEARAFLKGRSRRMQAELAERMEEAAAALDFERAAVYRDRIRALTQIQRHQGINPQTLTEADVFAAWQEGGQTCIQVFFFRAGQNWGNRAYFPRHDRELETGEVLDAFLAQFYEDRPPPRLVLLSHEIPGQALLAEALSIRAGRRHRPMPARRWGAASPNPPHRRNFSRVSPNSSASTGRPRASRFMTTAISRARNPWAA